MLVFDALFDMTTEEYLNVNGTILRHTVVPMLGDGACLFRSLSYLIHGTQVLAGDIRETIVNHVVAHWEEFSIMSHDGNGDNFTNSTEYFSEMSRPSTYGGLCELIAASQIFQCIFEVYRNGELYMRHGFEGNPVKRLRFTQDLSRGHFDALLPSW